MKVRLFGRRGPVGTLLVVFVGAVALFSVIGDRGLAKSLRLWRECRVLDAEIATLEQETRRLRKNVDAFRSDLRTIERFAREELRLVGENEIQYIFR